MSRIDFDTRTEVLGRLHRLESNTYYEITHLIVNRRTGQRATVTIAGKPAALIEQAQTVYDDGWGFAEKLELTRRDTTPRLALGANRTRFGY